MAWRRMTELNDVEKIIIENPAPCTGGWLISFYADPNKSRWEKDKRIGDKILISSLQSGKDIVFLLSKFLGCPFHQEAERNDYVCYVRMGTFYWKQSQALKT